MSKAARPPITLADALAFAARHRPERNTLIALALVALFAVVSYSNTFGSPFVFDDITNITESPAIRDVTNFLNPSRFDSLPDTEEFRLVKSRLFGLMTFALNYSVHGLSVGGYHAANLLIHILASWLLFALIRQIPGTSGDGSQHASLAAATGAALIFATHPVQTQAVTYIVQRLSSLSAMLSIAAVSSYMGYRLMGIERPPLARRGLYALALLCTVLAMKTKETAFTLPALIGMAEFMFFSGPPGQRARKVLPFVLCMPIIPIALMGSGGGEADVAGFGHEYTRMQYLLSQGPVMLTYLRLALLPFNQNLDYDYPQGGLTAATLAPWALICTLLFATAWLTLRYKRTGKFGLAAFGLVWFFVSLSVESSVIPLKNLIFEHRMYLPMAGLAMVAADAFRAAHERMDRGRSQVLLALVAAMICLLSAATYNRNSVWESAVALWSDAASKSPQKSRPHANLAVHLKNADRTAEAMEEFARAINIDPGNADALNNLGSLYRDAGQEDRARDAFELALKADPNHALAHANLGMIYAGRGLSKLAYDKFELAVKLLPASAEARLNLAIQLISMGSIDEAASELRTAIALRPDLAEAHFELGVLMFNTGNTQMALNEFYATTTLDPKNADAQYNLGVLLANGGNLGGAEQAFKSALAAKPDMADALNNLGMVYMTTGRIEEAYSAFSDTLRIDPGHSLASTNLKSAEAMLNSRFKGQ